MTKELEQTLSMTLRAVAYSMDTTSTETRKRFSKEIAEELLAKHGAFAHMYALEKLEGYESSALRELWRDVLMWLDELGGNYGRGVDKNRDGCGEEH